MICTALISVSCNQEKADIDAKADAAKDEINKKKQGVDKAAADAEKLAQVSTEIGEAEIKTARNAAQAQLDAGQEKSGCCGNR